MARLNKKILVFVDESGAPGDPDFMLGAVAIAARHVAVAGSILGRLRPSNAGELHAVGLRGRDARAVLRGLRDRLGERDIILINKASAHHRGEAPEAYAGAVIEIAKVAIQRYAALARIPRPGNVELVLDRTGLNTAPACRARLERAQAEDGRFRAVSHVAAVDSAAVPFLQLADLTAYARRWCAAGEIGAAQLRTECGIELL